MDPVAEALAAQAAAAAEAEAPPTAASTATPAGIRPPKRRARSSSTDVTPAPRVVPQPSNTVIRRSILLSILFLPFSLLYKLLSSSFNLFTIIFPFLRPLQRSFTQGVTGPRRAPPNPRDTAARFIREFEESTSVKDLPWFEGGYAQAMDLAKKEVRILMVYLQSDEHDDTAVYNKETLANPTIIQWMREQNVVLWGGSVASAEAYQVAQSLSVNGYPFIALITLTPPAANASSSSSSALPTTMSTILKLSGLLPPAILLSKLQTATQAHAGALGRIRAIADSHRADRELRNEQNSAYERSLARDRERARQRREAEEAAARAAEEERRAAEDAALAVKRAKAWILDQRRRDRLPAEPGAQDPAARVQLRFPSGDRVVRRFAKGTTMEEVYRWVECCPERHASEEGEEDSEMDDEEVKRLVRGYNHVYGFKLVSPMPRKVFEVGSKSVEDVGLWPSANLIVEEIDEDEE